MYRRYIVIGIVFFLLIGAYFIFFDKEEDNKEYETYYKKLVGRDNYNDNLIGVSLDIEEIEENNKYSYIVTIDDVSERQSNVKVLVANNNSNINNIEYFPNFGIIDNKGYTLITNEKEIDDKELKGINLTIVDSEKIEYMLIYFASDNGEQFVKVEIANYLN